MKKNYVASFLSMIVLLSGCSSIQDHKSSYETRQQALKLEVESKNYPSQITLPIKKADFLKKIKAISGITSKEHSPSYRNEDFLYRKDVVIQTDYDPRSDELYDILMYCNTDKRDELLAISKAIIEIFPFQGGASFIQQHIHAGKEEDFNVGKYLISISSKDNQVEIYIAGQEKQSS